MDFYAKLKYYEETNKETFALFLQYRYFEPAHRCAHFAREDEIDRIKLFILNTCNTIFCIMKF